MPWLIPQRNCHHCLPLLGRGGFVSVGRHRVCVLEDSKLRRAAYRGSASKGKKTVTDESGSAQSCLGDSPWADAAVTYQLPPREAVVNCPLLLSLSTRLLLVAYTDEVLAHLLRKQPRRAMCYTTADRTRVVDVRLLVTAQRSRR